MALFIISLKNPPIRQKEKRGALRKAIFALLGDIFNDCREMRINRGPLGKPYLRDSFGAEGPPISLSYSGSLAIVLLGGRHDLGVDMEVDSIRRQKHLARLMESWGYSTSGDAVAKWTRIEAWAKANGDGFANGVRKWFTNCEEPGKRPDGLAVWDLDIEPLQQTMLWSTSTVRIAICTRPTPEHFQQRPTTWKLRKGNMLRISSTVSMQYVSVNATLSFEEI